jgi:hypothetical protein
MPLTLVLQLGTVLAGVRGRHNSAASARNMARSHGRFNVRWVGVCVFLVRVREIIPKALASDDAAVRAPGTAVNDQTSACDKRSQRRLETAAMIV